MCGIAGVVAKKTSRKLTRISVTMLQVLQTRGHESCGVAYSDGERLRIEKGMGTVDMVFHKKRITTINKDKPAIIMGHNRYTTAGGSSLSNAHPFYLSLPGRRVAVAINGNTPYLEEKQKPMISSGARPFTNSDTEFILNFIVEASGRYLHNLVIGIEKFMKNIKASYSGSLLVREKLYLFRDPYANRPLVYGELDGIFAYASETAALEKIGVKKNKIKEVEPGTIMEVSMNGEVKVHRVFSEDFCKKNCAHCIFCGIYFARPDSLLFNELPVAIFRQKLGKKLYQQCGFKPGALTPVPDSGNQSFIGYARASGSEPQFFLVKDSQISRTFITPGQQNRAAKARLKYNPISFLIEMYKTIMIIDDSIVRATTIREIIKMIRKVVKNSIKIHIGSVSPPIKYPCYHGIDFPTRKELVAADRTQEEVRKTIGADGLYYLSYEGLIEVMKEMSLNPDDYCKACFDGEYLIPLH